MQRLYWILLGLLLAGFLFYQHGLELTYPAPWPDEGLFLWQSLAFRDTGTLLAPELCEKRDIFFMPPGYMLVQGLIFKLTGFSLPWARLLSALHVCGTIGCFAYLARRFEARFAHLLLFAAFLCSPIAHLAGNTARMETLVVLTGAVGLVLLVRARLVGGFAVLSLAPLVHPNGLFVVLLGILYVIGKAIQRGLVRTALDSGEFAVIVAPRARIFGFSMRRWEAALLIGVALSWLAFLIYFTRHWNAFVWDLALQLHWKQNTSPMLLQRLRQPGHLPFALLFGASVLPALRFAPRC
ncbi:MAG TPA: hypothetical protein VK524_28130, partial [Polyangiaceae bacterium]|nr:hypothetical protein [Polyangiaceae bacterium]